MSDSWKVLWFSSSGLWLQVGASHDSQLEAVMAIIKYKKLFPRAEYKVERDTS